MDDDFFSRNASTNPVAHPPSAFDSDELKGFEAAIGQRFGGASPSALLTTRLMSPSGATASQHASSSSDSTPALGTPFAPRAPPPQNAPSSFFQSVPLQMPKPLPTPGIGAGPSSSSPFAFASSGHFPRTPMAPESPMSSFNLTLPAGRKSMLPPPDPSRTPSGPLSQLSLRSPPPAARPSQSQSASAASSAQAKSTSSFHSYAPSDVPRLLRDAATGASSSSSSPPSKTLIVDIRNHQHFMASRIPFAINLSVPSTLLKRPNFSLQKLAEMIPLDSDRDVFASWKVEVSRIIVYDTDTSVLAPGNNILGLLNKFVKEGFTGELGFVLGGFNALAKMEPGTITSSSLEGESTNESPTKLSLGSAHLPSGAFEKSSTSTKTGMKPTQVAVANPFYDNIRQNLELSGGITERIPLTLPRRILEREADLPFPWLRALVRKASNKTVDGVVGGEALEELAMQFYRIELGEQRRLNGIMEHHSQESTNGVTGPRRREVKSDPAAKDEDADALFPYSITAGVEKGAKNRYRNIWPFEHARVRLQNPVGGAEDGTGYINASYVQPRGTSLKYIATQGPLTATFDDFWTLVWEQNVSIIVMLTRQIEGHSIKSHCYWKGERFGSLRLQCTEVIGPVHLEQDIVDTGLGPGGQTTGFDFTAPSTGNSAHTSSGAPSPGVPVGSSENDDRGSPIDEDDGIIRRTFLLSNTDRPDIPPRKIVQLQFLGWPDLNVPSSSKPLLELISQVDELRTEFRSMGGSHGIDLKAKENKGTVHPGPVLVHCSAGVGRTGSFVMIDAILDAIRRELRTRLKSLASAPTGTGRTASGDSADSVSVSSAAPRLAVSPPPDSHRSSGGDFASALTSHNMQIAYEGPDSNSDRPGIIRLDSDGNEVLEPGQRSVKKRRSSLGAGSTSTPRSRGGSLGEAVDFAHTHTRATPPPPVPPLPNFDSSSPFDAAAATMTPPTFVTSPLQSPGPRTASPSAAAPEYSMRRASIPNDGGPSPKTSLSPETGISNEVKSRLTATNRRTSTSETGGSTSTPSLSGSFYSTSVTSFSSFSSPPSTSSAPTTYSPGSGFLTPENSEVVGLEKDDNAFFGSDAGGGGDASRAPPMNLRLPFPSRAGFQLQRKDNISTTAIAGTPPLPKGGPWDSPALSDTTSSRYESTTPDLSFGPSSNAPQTTNNATSMRLRPFAPAFTAEGQSEAASGRPGDSQLTATSSFGTGDHHHSSSSPSRSTDGPRGAYDYAPPRNLWLSKEVRRNARKAERTASATQQGSTSTGSAPPSHASRLRNQSTIAPSPLSAVTTAPSAIDDLSTTDDDDMSDSEMSDGSEVAEEEKEQDTTSSEEREMTPEPLNGLDEPIRQVLEDMREQRMSLCQTLRQYVFVHLVVLEGSLRIVDDFARSGEGLDSKIPAKLDSMKTTADDLAAHYASSSSSPFDIIRPSAGEKGRSQSYRRGGGPTMKRLSVKRKNRSNELDGPSQGQGDRMQID